MPLLPQPDYGEMLLIAGNFIFMVWFLLISTALLSRRHSLANALTAWIIGWYNVFCVKRWEPGILKVTTTKRGYHDDSQRRAYCARGD